MTQESKSLLSTALESGLQVDLHPLPLLNVSEHYTRSKLQSGDSAIRVCGALLGTQQGRQIEITNSFEFSFHTGTLDVDHAFFTTRRDQFKQVFPTYEVVGWYSTSTLTGAPEPSPEDLAIHQQLVAYNENPLFLQLLPIVTTPSKELPIEIFENITEIVANVPKTFFIRVPYKVETGEAERVAVDHASKPSGSGPGVESAYIANLNTQRNALKMLQERVLIIGEYIQRLGKGTAPKDHDTLRQIAALTASLPAADSIDFQNEYMTEYSDILLSSYLATLTKELGPFNDLIDRFAISQSGNRQLQSGGSQFPSTKGSRRMHN